MDLLYQDHQVVVVIAVIALVLQIILSLDVVVDVRGGFVTDGVLEIHVIIHLYHGFVDDNKEIEALFIK